MNAFTQRLRDHPALASQIVRIEHLPEQEASTTNLDILSSPMAEALNHLGIHQLYDHQHAALGHIFAGNDVLVSTPTASGKSLVFAVPIMERWLKDKNARALFLYPTKALTQDQFQSLADLAAAMGALDAPQIAIYDGDTPTEARKSIRKRPPHLLMTNPDMLHLGLLPYAESWQKLLQSLAFIVVDEMHVYRGVFGAHVRHVLWRLIRTAERFGAKPQVIGASATVGNPKEFGKNLLNVTPTVIEKSGAPKSEQDLVLMNPVGVSPYTTTVQLLIEAIREGKRTIVFTKSRKITELLYAWTCRQAPELQDVIAPYRGGYLPLERRRLEQDLFSGRLSAVIATSALELGIDVGDLDVCILVGWPGSIQSAWQRAGRAGRASRPSTVIWVAMPDALEQWIVKHPQNFLAGQYEPAILDPWNEHIAGPHLVSAAAESPLKPEELPNDDPRIRRTVHKLEQDGKLSLSAKGDCWFTGRRRPQHETRLRASGTPFSILDEQGKPLGSVDAMRVHLECHLGAIYLHGGKSYEVVQFDESKKQVTIRPTNADWYTQVQAEKQTEILEVYDRDFLAHRFKNKDQSMPMFPTGWGRIRVTVTVKGYQKKRWYDGEPFASLPLEAPPLQYETEGMWVELPVELAPLWTEQERHFMGSIHAVEHACIGLFPLLAIADRGDVGGISYTGHPQLQSPAFFLYDGMAGGAGLALRAFHEFDVLIEKTLGLISECECEEGCPGCIQSPRCGNGNKPLDKQGALNLLNILIGNEPFEVDADSLPELNLSRATVAVTPEPSTHARGQSEQRSDSLAPRGSSNGTAPIAVTTPTRRHGVRRAGNLTVEELDQQQRSPSENFAEPSLLFFDLETQRSAEEVGGWGCIDKMGLALAVVFNAETQRFTTYQEADVDRLLLDLVMADCVVGFNVDRFDLRVLGAYTSWDLSRIRTCDMLQEIYQTLGYRLSLGHLAEVNLGEGKSADGLQSLAWWKEGNLEAIESYCRKDVDVTRRLFELGRKQGYLLYEDKRKRQLRVPVRW